MAVAVLLQASPSELAGSAEGFFGTFWFALALINAAIAQLNGRRGLNWFLVSLFLGPFATLMLVLLYRKA